MWGRAGQVVSTVLAVVLLYPVSPSGPTGAAATLGPYFTSGRAFPTLAQTRSERVLPAPSRTRSTHAYVRYISSRYVPVASRNAVIVGPNRIATFSSSANDRSYQLGEAGSFLFIHMVRRGMLEGHAPYSVESAFGFARDEIQREHPDQVPSISDGVPEDLVLGPNRTFVTAARYRPSRNRDQYASQREPQYQTYQSDYGSEPSPTPHRRPGPGPARVCGNISYDCPDR